MRKKGTKIAAVFSEHRDDPAPVAAPASAMAAATIGRIVAAHSEDSASSVMVDFPGSPKGPRPARLAISMTPAAIAAAVADRQPAVLVFENGNPLLPIVVGLVATPTKHGPSTVVEADVDGNRVRVVGQDEIVLQCGQASVTLRRNGRIIIRGTYVETHSEGTNRIKGGQVQIN